MATKVSELKEWLSAIVDEKTIAVDEGGLTLVVKGERSYFEIGGIPDEEGWE